MHATNTAANEAATAVSDKSSIISNEGPYNSDRGVGGGKSKNRHSTSSSNSSSGGNSAGSRVYGIAMYDSSSNSNDATKLGASASDTTIAATHSDVDFVIHNDGDIPVIDQLNSSSILEDSVVLTPLVPQPMDTVESTHNTTNTARYPTSPLDILVEAVNIRSTISAMSSISTSDRVAKRVRRSSSGMSLSSTIDDTAIGAMETSASVGIGDLCIATATAATTATVTKSMPNVPLNVYEEPEVEVFDPEMFHSLELDTFNYIIAQLQLYYTHTGKYLLEAMQLRFACVDAFELYANLHFLLLFFK